MRDEVRATLGLAAPIIIGLVGQRTTGIVDTIIAGRISTEAQAGLGLGASYFWTVAAIFVGTLMGLEPFFAQSVGARDERSLLRYLQQGAWLAAALAVGAIALMLAGARAYLGFTPAGGAREAFAAYTSNITWCLPAVMLYFLLMRYWQARQVVIPFTLMIFAAGALHIVADLALGLGWWGFPRLGAGGLAIAAAASRYLLLLMAVVYTWHRHAADGLNWVRPDWAVHRQILRIGLPVGGQVALEVSAFFIATFIASTLGAVNMAAHHVCFGLVAFSFMFPLGFSAAACVRVGTFIGEGVPLRARSSGWVGIGLAMTVMALFAAIYLSVPGPILRSFTPDPAVIAVAGQILLLVALLQIADGIQVTASGALRGIGRTRVAMLANLVGHFGVGVPVMLLGCYVLKLGVVGLWCGLAAGLFTAAGLLLHAWRRGTREIESIRPVTQAGGPGPEAAVGEGF